METRKATGKGGEDPAAQRRAQILEAALRCFARNGFHPTTMHDISSAAGISVGLIYRYFPSKEAVIAGIADEHQRELQGMIEQAKLAPSLREALEVLFTCSCTGAHPNLESAFVVDLFAECARNPGVRKLVGGVLETVYAGLTDLIASSAEAGRLGNGVTPRAAAELLVAVRHGMMMGEVASGVAHAPGERESRQIAAVRTVWRLLFAPESPRAKAGPARRRPGKRRGL